MVKTRFGLLDIASVRDRETISNKVCGI